MSGGRERLKKGHLTAVHSCTRRNGVSCPFFNLSRQARGVAEGAAPHQAFAGVQGAAGLDCHRVRHVDVLQDGRGAVHDAQVAVDERELRAREGVRSAQKTQVGPCIPVGTHSCKRRKLAQLLVQLDGILTWPTGETRPMIVSV